MKSSVTRDYVIGSPDDLIQLAHELQVFCGEKRVVAFHGEMGAGKTTFIRHYCALLGVQENVSSPTFSIINEYARLDGGKVFHFDFYRLQQPEESFALGIEEYFESGDWCLVEWPEKILYLMPEHRVDVYISVENDTRLIRFEHA